MQTKYPHITVKLIGISSNAYSLLGACREAAECAKLPHKEFNTFYAEATSGDYNHLIQTCMRWFTVS